jgi:hypothetical protein
MQAPQASDLTAFEQLHGAIQQDQPDMVQLGRLLQTLKGALQHPLAFEVRFDR